MSTHADLPSPDPDAVEHSARLRRRIVDAIVEAGGRLSFDRYMNLALYEPGLGYYSAGQRRFGAGGDFTTAPLMSALFSQTLARQTAEALERLGGVVLEFGAGTGRMAADVLRELAALDCLPERYLILEVSAALRQEQSQTLAAVVPELLDRVTWLDRLPAEPLRGVVLANEVLDALPVKRFQTEHGKPLEQVVTTDGDALVWELAPAGPSLLRAVAEIEADRGEPFPDGYVSEWCPGLKPWMAALAGMLSSGVALLVDYGYPRPEYYHAQRAMGTLLCHYRHRAHDDALFLPGLQDITASVDFTAAARAGVTAGLEVLGFATQAHFLTGAGLPRLLEEAMARCPDEAGVLTQQAKPLLFPGAMGERFKVLALGRGYTAALTGFCEFDHSHRLFV